MSANNVLGDARKGIVAFLGVLSLVLEYGLLHGQAEKIAMTVSAVLTALLPYLVPNGPLSLGVGKLVADVEQGTGFVADIPQPVVDSVGPVLKALQDQLSKMTPQDRVKLTAQLTQSAGGVSGAAAPSLAQAPEQTPPAPEPQPAAPEPAPPPATPPTA